MKKQVQTEINVWVNVYSDGECWVHSNQETAELSASKKVLHKAVLGKIVLDFPIKVTSVNINEPFKTTVPPVRATASDDAEPIQIPSASDRIGDVMKASSRKGVYIAINEERYYQDSLVNENLDETRIHTVGEEILMINEYAKKAQSAWTGTFGDKAGLDVVRKIAALCVRCMENHGLIRRGM